MVRDLGGMNASLYFVGSLLVSFFCKKLLYNSLIRKMYQVDKTSSKYQIDGSFKKN
jgi:hypothetical protein